MRVLSPQGPKTVKAGIHKLVELLRDSVWQRDTLERHVSTVTQELREKNDLLGEAELSRVSYSLWVVAVQCFCIQ